MARAKNAPQQKRRKQRQQRLQKQSEYQEADPRHESTSVLSAQKSVLLLLVELHIRHLRRHQP